MNTITSTDKHCHATTIVWEFFTGGAMLFFTCCFYSISYLVYTHLFFSISAVLVHGNDEDDSGGCEGIGGCYEYNDLSKQFMISNEWKKIEEILKCMLFQPLPMMNLNGISDDFC